jgi:hypothetical protein
MSKPYELEMFRTGDYGAKGNYTENDINQIIKNTQERNIDVPITVGHQKADYEQGAVGWLKPELLKLKNGLMSGGSVILDEFLPALKKKVYKYLSVGIGQKEGKKFLSHVAVLGATPPEVKGLKPINWAFGSDTELTIFDFKEDVKKDLKKIKMEDTKKMEDKAKVEPMFSESHLNALVKARVDEKTAEYEIKFSGQNTEITKLKGEKEALEKKVADFKDEFEKQEVENLVNGFIKEGKIEPKDKEAKIKLFSEAKKNKTIFDYLIEDMKKAKVIEFGEDGEAITKVLKKEAELNKSIGITDEDVKKYADGVSL